MTKCETAICQLAVNVYGKTSQCTVCMEEMAELTKELSKNLRGQDNAAHILEVILLGLFHIQIFCQGLSASGGGLELCPQLRDEQGLRLPDHGPPAATGGDGYFAVKLHGSHLTVSDVSGIEKCGCQAAGA